MTSSLNGTWKSRPDPHGAGEREKWFDPSSTHIDSSEWEDTEVPSCWNCAPRFERYEGTFWYARSFDAPQITRNEGLDVSICFKAVNYFCRAWLNGTEIGTHEGGYLPFEFAVPAGVLLPAENLLVVMVENERRSDRVPGELFDWFNYGGIPRDVDLIARGKRHFASIKVHPGIDGADGKVSVSWRQQQPFPFKWRIKDGEQTVAEGSVDDTGGIGRIDAVIAAAKFWSPDTPHLYTLECVPARDSCEDGKTVTFGVRTIETRGTKILLNGKQVKLRGVSLHEEQHPGGRTMSRENRFDDARAIKDLGFNAMRTGHYTHDEALLDAADELGLLVLEEIPVYWDLDYENPKLFETASAMLRDMIDRDFNHPSVIQWSVGNEIPVENPACDSFIRRLMGLARELDPTRLSTYVSCRFLLDKTRADSDVCCINCYVGWYFGREKDLAELLAMTRTTAPDKPWVMTEFGAGAEAGFHSRNGAKFSEEKQARFLSHYIRTLNGLDWISGWFIWIYRDFRSPIRNNRHQRGFNRKGIVSGNNREKLVCSLFPELAEEKYDLGKYEPSPLKVKMFEALERTGYALVQPAIARSQKKQYEKFYRKDID